VVPLVRAGDAIVHELVTHWLPRLATVVGALDQLPEPAAGLRRIQPIRVSRRTLEVVDLPARKVGATDVPPFALGVRRQDERALTCTNQYSYSTHRLLLPEPRTSLCRQPMGSSSRSVVERAGSRSTYPTKKIDEALDYHEVLWKSSATSSRRKLALAAKGSKAASRSTLAVTHAGACGKGRLGISRRSTGAISLWNN